MPPMEKIQPRKLLLPALQLPGQKKLSPPQRMSYVFTCRRVADCKDEVWPSWRAGRYQSECPGCRQRIWVEPPIPKGIVVMPTCLHCIAGLIELGKATLVKSPRARL